MTHTLLVVGVLHLQVGSGLKVSVGSESLSCADSADLEQFLVSPPLTSLRRLNSNQEGTHVPTFSLLKTAPLRHVLSMSCYLCQINIMLPLK